MQPTEQICPIFPLIGAVAFMLFGILAGRKMSGRKRWFAVATCAVPMIVLTVMAWRIWQELRADARRSRDILFAISPEPDFGAEERKAFQTLSCSSPRVREGVMRLAFANPTNALRALPRMEILIQSALQLDPTGKGREHLWNAVVQPALHRQPSRE